MPVVPDARNEQPIVVPDTFSLPAILPEDCAVAGNENVRELVQVPKAVNVISNSIHVVFPKVFLLADVVVKVALPHVGVSVKADHAVPVSPVPPLATARVPVTVANEVFAEVQTPGDVQSCAPDARSGAPPG